MEVWKREVQKRGTVEARKCGCAEVRKCGSAANRGSATSRGSSRPGDAGATVELTTNGARPPWFRYRVAAHLRVLLQNKRTTVGA